MHLLESRVGRYVAFAAALLVASAIAVAVEPAPRGRVIVTDTETEILDVVRFAPGTALVSPTSFATLDAVAATLNGNPSITLVEVQSHTSGAGDENANLALSEERARVVMAYLVTAGVDAARLTAQGYGDTQPLDRACSLKNERIAFLILKRDGQAE
jgi:OOP family OmpA-OmpF porin